MFFFPRAAEENALLGRGKVLFSHFIEAIIAFN